LQLQKYRIAIIAAFAQLAVNLKDIHPDDLAQWNTHARSLLEETSEAYVKAKSNTKLEVASHKEVFEFFGVPGDKIDVALRAFYGQ
jgi:3-hydroxyacyl-CoA dehydrogenase